MLSQHSFLILDASVSFLKSSVAAVLLHAPSEDIEIVIGDNAADPRTWEMTLRLAKDNPGKISIWQNRCPLTLAQNRVKAIQMCTGKTYTELSETSANISAMIQEAMRGASRFCKPIPPQYSNRYPAIRPITAKPRGKTPATSVCIHNYNYGQFLHECLGSVFAQTDSDFEVCFSDNASEDDSWDIALGYAARYPGRMNLCRNRRNFGAVINHNNAYVHAQGRYLLRVCSDDALKPTFLAECRAALTRFPEAGFVMVHRDILDDEGHIESEPPFYNTACLIPGTGQAAVYMMASVNPTLSQVFYDLEKREPHQVMGVLNHRWFGDRISDFNMCCAGHPVVYLDKALVYHRVHATSDSNRLTDNLIQCVSHYVLIHQMAEEASAIPGLESVSNRLDPARIKSAELCIRYALNALVNNKTTVARRYTHLACALSADIEDSPSFKALDAFWHLSPLEQTRFIEQLKSNPASVRRTVSYPPPPGSIPL